MIGLDWIKLSIPKKYKFRHKPETIEKIRIAMTGRKLSEETRRKMSLSRIGEKHWNYGKHLSEAHGSLTEVYPPLFEKYGVDLVITAHNHNYQRTYPLHSVSEVRDNPVIKDKNINNYSNPGIPQYPTPAIC